MVLQLALVLHSRYWTYGQCFTNLAERISVMCSFWCRGCPHTSYTNDVIHPHSAADYIVSALCLALCWALGTQRWKGLVLVKFAALLWGLKEYLIALASKADLLSWNVKGFVCLERKDFSGCSDSIAWHFSLFHMCTSEQWLSVQKWDKLAICNVGD